MHLKNDEIMKNTFPTMEGSFAHSTERQNNRKPVQEKAKTRK